MENQAANKAGSEFVIEMLGITKRFPGIVANDAIDLRVKKGEIHALLGENGAGKSTLMNILFGLYEPDEGTVRINGSKVVIREPKDAIALGIGMIHQHFMLVETYTVLQNIILGAEPRKGLTIDYGKALEKVKRLSEQYGLHLDPHSFVKDISVGMQQRVEILKTLYRGADVLIFDEPTAVLTPQEIEELLGIMRSLVEEGKTIILITHKLKEIMAVCDRVTVIRRGKVVGTLSVQETNPSELAAKMVGRQVSFTVDKKPAQPGEPVLEVRRLTVRDHRNIPAVRDVSFEIRRGEILGIAGVDGNGQRELVEAITGLRPIESGEILLRQQPLGRLKPRQISELGVGYIPEDRQKQGLVLDFTVSENMVLKSFYKPEFTRGLFLDYGRINRHAANLIAEYDVRTPHEQVVTRALSGGNQQKVIVAREICGNPDLLIATQPTRGLDVGAIEYIHKKIVEQRDEGKAVLLYSLELDEIMNLSDRIAVMCGGKIVGIVTPDAVTEEEIGLMMAGSKEGKVEGIA